MDLAEFFARDFSKPKLKWRSKGAFVVRGAMAGKAKIAICRAYFRVMLWGVNWNENTIIALPKFRLPLDYLTRVGIPAHIEAFTRENPTYVGPRRLQRFCGFYFRQQVPVAICGPFTIHVDEVIKMNNLENCLREAVGPHYRIRSVESEVDPKYILIFDSYDGSCWLQEFEHGRQFLLTPSTTDHAGQSEWGVGLDGTL